MNIFAIFLALFAFLSILFFSTSVTFAAYPATKYAPGETLNPSCAPGDANCGVEQISIATSTQNYGIGTTTPYAKLSVVGEIVGAYFTGTTTATSTFGGNITISGTGTSTSAGGINLSAGCFAISGACLGSGTSATGGTGAVQFANGTAFTGDATNFFWDNTLKNLGVGTSSPFAKLSVGGSGYFDQNLTATNITATGTVTTVNLLTTSSSTLQNVTFVNATGTSATTTNFFATTASSTNLFTSSFSLGSLAGILKATAGSVGTALVSLATDITGTLGVANGGTGLATYTAGDVLYAPTAGSLAGTSTANLKATLGLNSVENTALSSWTGTSNITTLGTITTGTWNAGAITSSGVLSINGLGNSYVLGNFGIGTTTPGTRLSVVPSATSSSAITLYDSLGNASVEFRASTSTLSNTFIGTRAGVVNTTGSSNTANGARALSSNTTGYQNTATGVYALLGNTTGSNNTANGVQALLGNTTGSNNTANGMNALYANTTGSNNTVVGYNGLFNSQTGGGNSVFGQEAGYGVSTNSFASSTLLGYRAGYGLTTGSRNILLGYQAGDAITTGQGNIILGYDIDAPSATGNNQLNIGNLLFGTSLDGVGTTLSSGNIGIGTSTPSAKLTVDGNISVYDRIDFNNTDFNSKLGYQAGKNIVSGAQYNTFLGYQAGYSSSTASTIDADRNTAIGYQSLSSNNTTGYDNTAIGYQSLFSNTTGFGNIANGYASLYYNTTGFYNTANGSESLFSNTIGEYNTANGYDSLYSNTTGINNTANGAYALYSNTTGSYNTANGYQSLYYNTTGNSNTALGYRAGRYLTNGLSIASTTDFSLFLGRDTKALTDNDQNAIVIGYNANGLGSNTVVLGNDSIVTTALKGNVGIGTSTPYAKLSVAGEVVGAYFTGTTTSTSTFGGNLAILGTGTSTSAGGVNLSAGCFAIGGACIGASATDILATDNTINAFRVREGTNDYINLNTTNSSETLSLWHTTTGTAANIVINTGSTAGQAAGVLKPSVGAENMSVAKTITSVDTVGNVGYYTSTTLGADNFPVISYYDILNADLKVLKCGNASCSSGNTITTVDSVGVVGYYTSITLGADNFPIISHYDQTNGDLKVLKCGNTACSSGNTITTVDSTGDVGWYTSITLGTDNFPVVSYFDNTNLDLKVLKCGNASCSSGNTITTVDGTAGVGVGYYTSITLGADNFPIISHYDQTNGDLKVLKCGNTACSSGNTITTVDSTGDVGPYTSITLGADNFPVISYRDNTNGDLKVLKCGNTACSSGNTITTVDGTGGVGVGYYTSITLGVDNFPIVSYRDDTNLDLKVLKCGNASCSSGNTITTVDSTGDVGEYTSITLGTDNFPVVSYYDNTNIDLKVLKCADGTCSATTGIGYGGYGVDLGTATQFFRKGYFANLYAKNTTLSAFDIAEEYPTKDVTLKAGEVVALDPENPVFVKRAIGDSNERVVGIISTEPAILFSGKLSFGKESQPEEYQVALALAGRVPLRVTNEAGIIAIGDDISASKIIPGAGKKAEEGERVIGVALEPSAEGINTSILVMVHTPATKLGTSNSLPGFKNFFLSSTIESTLDSNREERESTINKLKNLLLSHRYYASLNDETVLESGISSENAPEELLTSDGSMIDIFKLVPYLTTGIKALIVKVDILENNLAVAVAKVMSFAKEIVTEKVTAQKINTKELCLSDGVNETCVTKAQLDSILLGVTPTLSAPPVSSLLDLTKSTSTPTTNDIVIIDTTTSSSTANLAASSNLVSGSETEIIVPEMSENVSDSGMF